MSEYLGSIRKIDNTGRLSIPKEIRTFLEIDRKTPLEIVVNKTKGEIIIKKAGNK